MQSMGEVRACAKGERLEKSPSPSLSPKGERSKREGAGTPAPHHLNGPI